MKIVGRVHQILKAKDIAAGKYILGPRYLYDIFPNEDLLVIVPKDRPKNFFQAIFWRLKHKGVKEFTYLFVSNIDDYDLSVGDAVDFDDCMQYLDPTTFYHLGSYADE